MKQDKGQSEEERQSQNDFDVLSNFSNSAASGHLDSIDSHQHKRRHFTPSLSFRQHHKNSFDSADFQSENEQIRLEEFFDDEIILDQKIQRKDVAFKSRCLKECFVKSIQEVIFKFVRNPSEQLFFGVMEQIFKFSPTIFADSTQLQPLLQDLFYHTNHTFIIFTFDWFMCHLSFVTCLLYFWIKVDSIEIQFSSDSPRSRETQTKRVKFIENQQRKIKQNIIQVACLYAQKRSQDINTNQAVLVLLYYFLIFLKGDRSCDLVEVCNIQNKLINDINLFRRLKRKQSEFFSSSNKVILESQMDKYEKENKIIDSLQKTYLLLKLITFHNFVSSSVLKYYQIYGFENSRNQAQRKKDIFISWVISIIIRCCEKKNSDSLHKSAYYVVTFMGILKKFKQDNNLEGISYLVPILENIRLILPKVWNHALKRRPQIEGKLKFYNDLLLKKLYKEEDLGGMSIVWEETIYGLGQKIKKQMSKNPYNLEEHEIFYEEILKPILSYREKAQKIYEQEIELYKMNQEIGLNFNMYLFDVYVQKRWKDVKLKEKFDELQKRGKKANQQIDNSIFIDLIDYCFIGSTNKYQGIDI